MDKANMDKEVVNIIKKMIFEFKLSKVSLVMQVLNIYLDKIESNLFSKYEIQTVYSLKQALDIIDQGEDDMKLSDYRLYFGIFIANTKEGSEFRDLVIRFSPDDSDYVVNEITLIRDKLSNLIAETCDTEKKDDVTANVINLDDVSVNEGPVIRYDLTIDNWRKVNKKDLNSLPETGEPVFVVLSNGCLAIDWVNDPGSNCPFAHYIVDYWQSICDHDDYLKIIKLIM